MEDLNESAKEKFLRQLQLDLDNGRLDIQTDNHGQLVIYTGQFVWANQSVGSTPDPEYSDDPTDA